MVFNATLTICQLYRGDKGTYSVEMKYVCSMLSQCLSMSSLIENARIIICVRDNVNPTIMRSSIMNIAEILPTGRSTTIIQYCIIYCRAIVIVIVWLLDLQLPCCEFESRSWRGVLDTTLCDKVCL